MSEERKLPPVNRRWFEETADRDHQDDDPMV